MTTRLIANATRYPQSPERTASPCRQISYATYAHRPTQTAANVAPWSVYLASCSLALRTTRSASLISDPRSEVTARQILLNSLQLLSSRRPNTLPFTAHKATAPVRSLIHLGAG